MCSNQREGEQSHFSKVMCRLKFVDEQAVRLRLLTKGAKRGFQLMDKRFGSHTHVLLIRGGNFWMSFVVVDQN
ncbi:hypothetical protein, partial [Brevibacillus parabrevis]|uniref:hypothetical protein n=1 Tax=Brevibacillus parabrevis TaxID=54914 RepID=UPI002E1D5324|nr:hypothetical protein [Brevibacillus parabrevis]